MIVLMGCGICSLQVRMEEKGIGDRMNCVRVVGSLNEPVVLITAICCLC